MTRSDAQSGATGPGDSPGDWPCATAAEPDNRVCPGADDELLNALRGHALDRSARTL
jgi:hypothetical protein